MKVCTATVNIASAVTMTNRTNYRSNYIKKQLVSLYCVKWCGSGTLGRTH